MCGFVVIVALDSGCPDAGGLARATELLTHRGPDDAGRFVEGGVAMGFRRLSVFDLSAAAHQPLVSADGRYVIVFNGAIFNFIELRAELQALGHRFRSSGDTEVLLTAYIQWGSACLARLNGMWAFVIYDRLETRLFGSRDRFGVKPLFLYADGRQFVFTSEIKAIRDSGLARLDVNHRTLTQFVFEGVLDAGDETFYKNVSRVPAGMAFETRQGGALSWHRYWSLTDSAQAEPAPSDPAAAFATLFEDSVALRMRSDVPVGVLLSGGIDSSSIICSMARQRPTNAACRLGALCYMDPQFDETAFIDATLAQTKASLWRLDVAPMDLWDTCANVLWQQDEPVHSINALVGYHLMQLARSQGVEVVLNGQGADETLAGYQSYFIPYWIELLRTGRMKTLHASLRDVAQVNGSGSRVYRGLLRACLGRSIRHLPGYAALSRMRRRRRIEQSSWAADDLKYHWSPSHEYAAPDLSNALQWSIEQSHLPVYLRVEDRNSMAHGVEMRLPFLDHRLVSLAFRLGSDWKLKGGLTKVLLREAMRGGIPERVRTRTQKFGFPVAINEWLRGPLSMRIRDTLASRFVRESGIWNMRAVWKALERHERGEANVGEALFDVVQACLWLQMSNEPVSFAQRRQPALTLPTTSEREPIASLAAR